MKSQAVRLAVLALTCAVAAPAAAQARRPVEQPWSQPPDAAGFPVAPAIQRSTPVAHAVLDTARAVASADAAPFREACAARAAEAIADATRAGDALRGPAIPLAERGRLTTPVRGTVIARPPDRPVADTNTRVRQAGWTWRVRDGAEVVAIADGVVAWTGWIDGLGGAVLVWHAPGDHSVYTGLRETLVARGDSVGAGAALGTAGATTTFDGVEVSVEIRHDGVPIDPAPMLRP